MKRCEGGKHHAWKGHGPNRECSKCKFRPGHVTDQFKGAGKKWTEKVEPTLETMKGEMTRARYYIEGLAERLRMEEEQRKTKTEG